MDSRQEAPAKLVELGQPHTAPTDPAASRGAGWIVTGAVLLLAAGFDAIVRRARTR
jgi:hypothetical protein